MFVRPARHNRMAISKARNFNGRIAFSRLRITLTLQHFSINNPMATALQRTTLLLTTSWQPVKAVSTSQARPLPCLIHPSTQTLINTLILVITSLQMLGTKLPRTFIKVTPIPIRRITSKRRRRLAVPCSILEVTWGIPRSQTNMATRFCHWDGMIQVLHRYGPMQSSWCRNSKTSSSSITTIIINNNNNNDNDNSVDGAVVFPGVGRVALYSLLISTEYF